jgi:hypothetical protein
VMLTQSFLPNLNVKSALVPKPLINFMRLHGLILRGSHPRVGRPAKTVDGA